jgi:hypothetical protein
MLWLVITAAAAAGGLASGGHESGISAPLQAELTQLSLNYARGTGEGDLTVYVPFDYLKWLRGMTGDPVVSIDPDPGPFWPPVDTPQPYASENAQITWIDSSGRQELLQIPFWKLVQYAWTGVPILNKRVNFQISGSPSGYPSDRWVISLDAVIRWPDFVEKPVVIGLESSQESDLVITTSGISSFHSHEEVGKLELSRPLTTQILLYSVILAPLLLVFAAGVSRLKASGGVEVPLELAAALISIFALRSVLVPAELPGLTRIDYLLAAETVAIISAAVLFVAFRPTSTKVD